MLKVTKSTTDYDKLAGLVFSNIWPVAVPPEGICPIDSELEKARRAEGMVEIILEKSAKACRVLDLGCGEGYSTLEIHKQRPSLCVGYDIKQQGGFQWEEQRENWILTTEWKKVEENAPYDIVFCYDVIDHMESIEIAKDIMTKIYDLTTPKARVYIRCHPWISRHGSHLYRLLNKAWIHIIFSEDELKRLIPNYTKPDVLQINNPLAAYSEIFARWRVKYRNLIHGNVEGIFHANEALSARISQYMDGPKYSVISHPFIDYVLVK